MMDDELDETELEQTSKTLVDNHDSQISKKSEKSEIVEVEEIKVKIELDKVCTKEHLVILKERFDIMHNNVMTQTELKEVIKDVVDVDFDDDDFKILFLKMNVNRNGVVNWDEFISYLLLCFAAKESEELKHEAGGLVPPISKRPIIIKSQHPHAINAICYSANIDKESFGNPIQGSYITTSPEGVVNRWTLDMQFIRSTLVDCTAKRDNTRTQILTATCMPDVCILAISTSKQELYFYDTTAGGMVARVIINKWNYNIEALYYHSNKVVNLFKTYRKGIPPKFAADEGNCVVVIGDVGGNVYVMSFNSYNLGPFQKRVGKPLLKISYKGVLKGKMASTTLKEYCNLHDGPVKSVSYYHSLNSTLSCSDSNTTPFCINHPLTLSQVYAAPAIPEGVLCFTFDEEKHVIVTGGSKGTVLLWSVFVPVKPSIILKGHHAAIVIVFLQNKCTKIYSMDVNRIIKIWSVRDITCLQSFSEIPASLGEHTIISAIYNSATRNLIVASLQIGLIECDPKLNAHHTDGFTHSKAVSVVLYNALFKTVVTCGEDSIIICWDIITGVRQRTIHDAHTKVINGETLSIEITAGTFHPGYQLLLTGARDGTLKTWNFNTGSCLKTMAMKDMHEITYVMWIQNRILAIGWNRHITEFDDTSINAGAMGKMWETRHNEDVSGGALRSGEVLGTISYGGELILWKLDTGRAIKFKRENDELPFMPQPIQHISALAIIFLESRPINATTANYLISLGDGKIQVWSEHPGGGYLGSFHGVHTEGDFASCFTTDIENHYLFTGTAMGYIKIWLLQNYYTSEKVHVSMPLLRLQFPFLWRDRIEGRAKRACHNQPLPLLLSSYRAHLRSIITVVYIPEYKYVLSGSADGSVRIWTLGGQYLTTLGTFLPWSLEPKKPPDIKKVASSTTLKVLNGGEVSHYVPMFGRNKLEMTLSDLKLLNTIQDKLPSDHLLRRICRMPKHPPPIPTIILDDSMPRIPVFTHLQTPATKALPERKESPMNVTAVRTRKEMQEMQVVKRNIQFQ